MMTNDITLQGATPERLLTLRETAAVLGCSIKSLRRLYAAGELPIVRLRGSIRVAPRDLERFIAAHRHG